jgi:hypothetical protein
MKTVNHISKILFDLDPFGTQCAYVEDIDMSDEYESEAIEICELLNTGSETISAFQQVLKEWDETFGGLNNEQIEYINANI